MTSPTTSRHPTLYDVRVRVFEGEDFVPRSGGALRNLFAIIECGKERFKTGTCKDTLTPKFNEQCIFKRKAPTCSVTITIQDKESWMDEFLGLTTQPLSSLLDTNPYDGIYSTGTTWLDLQRRSGKPADGRILVEVIATESREQESPPSSDDETTKSTASVDDESSAKRRGTVAGAALKKAGKVLLLGHLRGNSSSVQNLSASAEEVPTGGLSGSNSGLAVPKNPKQSRHRKKGSLQLSSSRGFNSNEALASPGLNRLGSFNSSNVLTENSESDTLSVPSFSMESESALSGADPSLQPEVTGVSPNNGPERGGTKLIIRGNNLGTERSDIIALTIAGVDCLSTLQWYSPSKLTVTTRPGPNAGKGSVVVTTRSGGRGICTVAFTFVPGSPTSDPVNLQKLVELQMEEDAAGDADADPIQRMSKKDLIEEVSRLRKAIQERDKEVDQLHIYIDKVIAKVLEFKPELLQDISRT